MIALRLILGKIADRQSDLVSFGLGHTVLPACGVSALLKERKLSASPIESLFVTWLVAKPKMRALSIAAQRFYEAICDMGREQIRANIWQPHT